MEGVRIKVPDSVQTFVTENELDDLAKGFIEKNEEFLKTVFEAVWDNLAITFFGDKQAADALENEKENFEYSDFLTDVKILFEAKIYRKAMNNKQYSAEVYENYLDAVKNTMMSESGDKLSLMARKILGITLKEAAFSIADIYVKQIWDAVCDALGMLRIVGFYVT